MAAIIATGVFFFFSLYNSVLAITLTPPRLELAGDPGQTITSEIKVTNDTDAGATYYTQVENFEAGDETGNPQFVTTKEGLATWVNVPNSVYIEAGQQKTIPFSISVPRSTEPGGYFASIFVRTTPPPVNGGEVSIGARLGSLILLRVNGNIREGVSILEFATKDKQRIYNSLPVSFYYRFQNTGADRVRPEGEIVVKNVFGLTAKILNANQSEGSVLPRSIRKFESHWITDGGGKQDEDLSAAPEIAGQLNSSSTGGFLDTARNQLSNFAIGYYTANLDLRYGENNNSASGKFGFFIIPWQLITIVLAVLILGWIILRTALRIYTRRIIKQHQRNA